MVTVIEEEPSKIIGEDFLDATGTYSLIVIPVTGCYFSSPWSAVVCSVISVGVVLCVCVACSASGVGLKDIPLLLKLKTYLPYVQPNHVKRQKVSKASTSAFIPSYK